MFDQRLLKKFKEKTNEVLASYLEKLISKRLSKYKKAADKISFKKIKKVKELEIVANLYKSKVSIFGEFHYSTLPKKSIRKYIKKLINYIENKEKKDVYDITERLAIAIEAVDRKYQKQLDQFINDEITYEKFCKKTDFDKNWGTNSTYYYKPLFTFCQEYRIKMIAINIDPKNVKKSLELRDKEMAKSILEAIRKNPALKIFAIVGDWHAESNHLHNELIHQITEDEGLYNLEIKDKIYSFYMNYDRLWEYKLKHGLLKHRWFKIDDNVYGISDTPPFVKKFSVLDHDKFVLESEDGDELQEDSLLEIFNTIVKDLLELLDLDLEGSISWDSQVEVFCPLEKELFFDRLESSKKESKFITDRKIVEITIQVEKFGSCFIPVDANTNYIYVSNTSTPNQYAQMATRYIRDIHIDKKKAISDLDKFYVKVIDEGLRFLGNKILNPFVECNEYEKAFEIVLNVERGLEDLYSDETIKAAAFFIKHVGEEKEGNLRKFAEKLVANKYITKASRNYEIYLGLIRSLGRALGRELYYRVGEFENKESIEKTRDVLLRDYGENALDWYAMLKGIE